MTKRLVFILSFLLALLVSVGAAFWVIVYQKQSPYPTELSGTFSLEISYADDLLTAQNGQLRGDLVKAGVEKTATPTTLVVKHTTPDGTVYSYPIHRAHTNVYKLENTELVYGVAEYNEDGSLKFTNNNSKLTAQTSGTTAVAVKVLLKDKDTANSATQKFLRALLDLPAPTDEGAENAPATFNANGMIFNVTNNLVKEVYQNNATVAMPAIAYNGSNYYGTIEGALVAHTSGKTYIIANNTEINPYILKERTISGTLILPYSGTSETSTLTHSIDKEKPENSVIANLNAYLTPETYLKTVVTVRNKLTVNGTLTIGGIVHAGPGGAVAGQTCGNYAQITVVEGGKIQVNKGANINCYGFIKGTTEYDDIEFLSGSNLQIPFVLHEFRGGTVSSALQNDDKSFATCPFLRFTFPNIDGAYRINYGAIVKAQASLYAQSQKAQETAAVIGTSDDCLIKLSESTISGVPTKLDIFYDPTARKGTDWFGTLMLNLYGSASLNALDISNSAASVSSAGSFLPISYLYDVHFYTGTYSLSNQNIKILPGGSVTVHEGATVTTTAKILCYQESPQQGAAGYFPYPAASTLGGGGKLIVNGKLTATTLGGAVYSTKAGAELNVEQTTADDKNLLTTYHTNTTTPDTSISTDYRVYEATSIFGYKLGTDAVIYFNTTAENLTLDNYNDSSTLLKAGGKYYSKKRSDGVYGWYSANFKITYDSNRGSSVADTSVSLAQAGGYTFTETILSGKSTTREHYTFSHWCTQDNCTNGSTCANNASGKTVYGDTTLYAAWKKNKYKLNYVYVIPDGDGVKEIESGITSTDFDINTTTITLNTAPTAPTYTYVDEKTGQETTKEYNFSGWFTAAQNGEPIDSIIVEDYCDLAFANGGKDGEVTIYAVWIKDIVYTVHFNNSHNAADGGYVIIDSTTVKLDDEGNGTLSAPTTANDGKTLLTAHNNNPNDRMYFVGWYVDENFETEYIDFAQLKALVPEDGENYKRTLYAKWVEKQYTISFVTSYPSGTTGSPTAPTPANAYLHTNQTLDLATNINDKMTIYDANSAVNKYFNGWTATGATIEGTILTPTANTITLTANWETKATLSFATAYPTDKTGSPTAPSLSSIYVKPNAAFTIPTDIANKMIGYDNTTAVNYYFNGWTTTSSTNITKVEGTSKNIITIAEGATTATLATNWTKKYSVTATTLSNATVTLTYNGTTIQLTANNSVWFYPSAQLTFGVSYTKNKNQTFTVKQGNTTKLNKAGSLTINGDLTVSASSEEDSGGCVTPDTLITLADGTQKRVDQLRGDELLLVWNLNTGKYDVAPIVFVDSESETEYEIVHLYFSDGSDVKVIYEHGFFDINLKKYVYIDAYNYAQFIGHEFVTQGDISSNTWKKATLTKVVIETERTTAYSPVTFEHLCYYTNGVLSMPGGISGLFNIFEVNTETMSYNEEQMQKDIETYGLFSYDDFKDLIPEVAFDAFNGKWLKVAIGKGMLTWEDIEYLAARYVPLV